MRRSNVLLGFGAAASHGCLRQIYLIYQCKLFCQSVCVPRSKGTPPAQQTQETGAKLCGMVSKSPSDELSPIPDQVLDRMSCSVPELNPCRDTANCDNDDDKKDDEDGSGIIRLNVGGRVFNTTKAMLQKFPDTFLGSLSPQSTYFNRRKREYFFDRNPTIFAAILDFYRNDELHLPQNVCGNAALRELRFWHVPSSWVSDCCWSRLNTAKLERQMNSDLQRYLRHRKGSKNADTCRSKVWVALTDPRSSKAAMIWSAFVVTATLVTVILFTLDMIPQFRESRNTAPDVMASIKGGNRTKMFIIFTTKTRPAIWVTDLVTLSIMVAEFLVKLLVCPNLKSFLTSFFNIVYSCCLLACCIAHVVERYFDQSQYGYPYLYAFCVLRSFHFTRLLRVLDLLNSHPALRVVWIAFTRSRTELLILLLVFLILAAMFGPVAFYCELGNSGFASDIAESMYWAVITMTTVGYGDLLVSSACGHMVAVVCSLMGMVILAIPVAVLTQRFHMYHAQQVMYRERFELRARRCRLSSSHRVSATNYEWSATASM